MGRSNPTATYPRRVADRDGSRRRPARRGDKPGCHVVPNFAGWVSTLLDWADGSKGLSKKVAYDAAAPLVSDPPEDPTHVTTVLGCQLVKAA